VPQKAVSKKPALFHTNFFDPNLTHYFLQNNRYLLKYTSNRETVFTSRQRKPLATTFFFDPITIRRKEVPQKAVSKKPALFHTNFFDPNLTHYFLQNNRYLLKYTSNRETVFTT
jgi:hypothetical protein